MKTGIPGLPPLPAAPAATHSLTWAYAGGQATTSITLPTSSAQTLDGGPQLHAGLFNLEFDWATFGGGRFDGGETSTYKIKGTGLSASDFLYLSAADPPDAGGWYTAAEVRGFGSSGSIGTATTGTGSGGTGTTTAAKQLLSDQNLTDIQTKRPGMFATNPPDEVFLSPAWLITEAKLPVATVKTWGAVRAERAKCSASARSAGEREIASSGPAGT